MSLIQQASDHNLPLIQNMDQETLSWIIENNPFYDNKIKKKDFLEYGILEKVKQYLPKKEWFLSDEIYQSIHGIRHILRVSVNVSNLLTSKSSEILFSRNCLIAASLHDIRRQNDKGDIGHGERSAKWFLDNSEMVSEYYQVVLSANDIDEISSSISFHEIPYSELFSDGRYLKNKDIVDIIKTSDALDRYRLPKIKWWINDQFIKLIPTEKEKIFAYELVVLSEKNYLEGVDGVNSVFSII